MHTHTHTGTAITLNLADQGDSGTMYEIVPETTKDYANVKTCFVVPGTADAPVTAQGVLPNTTLYQVGEI